MHWVSGMGHVSPNKISDWFIPHCITQKFHIKIPSLSWQKKHIVGQSSATNRCWTPRVWKLTQGSTSPHIKTHTVTDLCGEVWNLPEVYIIEIVWKNAAYAGDGKKVNPSLYSLYSIKNSDIYIYNIYVCVIKLAIRNKILHIQVTWIKARYVFS